MLPASSVPVSRATSFASSSARRLIRSSVVLAADDPQLLAVRVVGERLDDVRARVDELAVQLGHLLRVLEHDLGDERARLQVAAPLELEEVALGADHRPRARRSNRSAMSDSFVARFTGGGTN